MNTTDLIDNFRTTYDLGSLGLPGFEDSEIKELLETAQYRVISQKFGGNNVYKQKFPDSEKRIDDLSRLMQRSELSLTDGNAGIKVIILPSTYLHLVNLTLNDSHGYPQNATQIDYSKIARFQNSRNNLKAYIKNPVFIIEDFRIKVYVDTSYDDTYSLETAELLYLREPVDLRVIASSSELSDFGNDVYYEIVASAVDNAISIATPMKSQVSSQQLNKSE